MHKICDKSFLKKRKERKTLVKDTKQRSTKERIQVAYVNVYQKIKINIESLRDINRNAVS